MAGAKVEEKCPRRGESDFPETTCGPIDTYKEGQETKEGGWMGRQNRGSDIVTLSRVADPLLVFSLHLKMGSIGRYER